MPTKPIVSIYVPTNVLERHAAEYAAVALFRYRAEASGNFCSTSLHQWDGTLKTLPNMPVMIVIDYARGLPNCKLDDLVSVAERAGHLLLYQGRQVMGNGSVQQMTFERGQEFFNRLIREQKK